jgi:branched-chain amino acid transport system ATP-binding protein
MSDPMLEMRGLRAGFGPTAVLHGVDLAVGGGELVALLGLNGAGKSVTLKVVGGFVPAWAGTVLVNGRDITTRSPEARVALGIGHVPQGRQLFPELTVEENLRLGGYLLRRRDRARYATRVAELYDQFPRLGERKGQLAGTMSGGEQAMLAVARALVSEPKIVLVDEPSAGLAPIIAEELFLMLREVNRSGVTMLLVEQNVGLALRVADRIAIMQRGRVVHDASTGELDQAALVQYLGIGRLLAPSPRNGAKPRRATKKAAAR